MRIGRGRRGCPPSASSSLRPSPPASRRPASTGCDKGWAPEGVLPPSASTDGGTSSGLACRPFKRSARCTAARMEGMSGYFEASNPTHATASRRCLLRGIYNLPHWEAIAAAIPGNVRLRSFHRSGPGEARCTLGTRPATIIVGTSLGRFFNHKQVAFVSPITDAAWAALHPGTFPNIQGWMIWVGLRIREEMTLTGFSNAILLMGASSRS